MNEKLVIYEAWILFGSIGLVLIMLLIIFIYNYIFIKNNSRELSERIYGIEEYLDNTGVNFETVLKLSFVFSFMFFSRFIEYPSFGRMSYFVKRGEKNVSLYPNLYQDNVFYLCEKFKKQIIIHEILEVFCIMIGVIMFTYKYIAIYIVNLSL
ncbi:hypothetical protein [Acinetobacter higginsii]|uniref:hypothetical protein n=1 Tax=Acinetobacter higginsii TaxID=70347 RepID=UPI001F61A95A|nr:hypothetical protein [Acinetobacter higginsii]MCI3878616.1 hypothetical protein [Acinetobacter higginsii]